MSRLGFAPAIISSMLRRRTSSSGSPVTTWTCHGCVFIEDGARLATSRISSISVRGTFCFLKPAHTAARLHQLLEIHSLLPRPLLGGLCSAPQSRRHRH